MATPLTLTVLAVAGGACLVADNRLATFRQTVEER